MGDGAGAGKNAARTVGHHASGEVTPQLWAFAQVNTHPTGRFSCARHRAEFAPSEGASSVHLCPKANLRSHSRALRAAAASVIETLEGRRLFDATLEPVLVIDDTTPEALENFGD